MAHADPSAADKETARALMNEGRTDRDKGDLKAAVKAFAAADALMHVPTTASSSPGRRLPWVSWSRRETPRCA